MDIADLGPDPLARVQHWLDEAFAAGIVEAHAMSLATADVTVRTVLLKGIDHGFVFFTNYRSAKAQALEVDERAALSLTWPTLGRQVRARGAVEQVSPAESDDYFATRPRGSQLAAWASPQSEVIQSREVLEQAVAQLETRFPGDVSRPPHWGGYRLVPSEIEFWSRRDNRLHDRIRFRRVHAASRPPRPGWAVDRLAP
jgi:pyridoxamine 5'-phosphate oxidase